jgi:HD-GYP domain-containing protein (c-di-GMP phosphodiesterase class II)
MELVEVQVPVEKLKLGMYVSRLDIPWLESPFFFQGFPIETVAQIEEIQEVCQHVFVDTEKSSTLPDLEPDITSSGDGVEVVVKKKKKRPSNVYSELALKSSRRFREWKPYPEGDADANDLNAGNRTDYGDEVKTEEELVAARQTLDDFQSVVEETFDALRTGGQIDHEQIDRTLGGVVASMARNPDALIWLARLGNPDEYTFRHCVNMSIWAISLGRQIGLPRKDLNLLGKGALYCDIGKAKVPPDLLNRAGPLTEWEMEVVKQHVDFSIDIIEQLGDLDPAALAMVAQHHESHDATGYPYGLAGDEIDLYARIAAIADCFDAMINTRAYRQGVPISEAIRQMYQLRGHRFQPELMEEFIHAIGLYPAGTLVELSTGQVGAVIGESRVRRLRPRVMLLLDSEKNSLEHFPVVDLMQEDADAEGNPLHIARDLEPGAYDLDPSQYFLV